MAANLVPAVGITNKTGRYVPSRLPHVETAYIRPLILPASEISLTPSLIAKGDIQPSNVTGTNNAKNTAIRELITAPTLTDAIAAAAERNMTLVRRRKKTDEKPAAATNQ